MHKTLFAVALLGATLSAQSQDTHRVPGTSTRVRVTQEDGKDIDSAGKLVTGEDFSNVMELKKILVTSRKQDFYRCLTEKMLTYALGRGVEYYDAPSVDAIIAQTVKAGGGLKDLVNAITESVPFQKRRGDRAF